MFRVSATVALARVGVCQLPQPCSPPPPHRTPSHRAPVWLSPRTLGRYPQCVMTCGDLWTRNDFYEVATFAVVRSHLHAIIAARRRWLRGVPLPLGRLTTSLAQPGALPAACLSSPARPPAFVDLPWFEHRRQLLGEWLLSLSVCQRFRPPQLRDWIWICCARFVSLCYLQNALGYLYLY